jgi:prevent-host-death family protein
MESVGIRELKNNLSRHLKRVRSGTRLLVTQRGRSIATINPVEEPRGTAWVSTLLETGHAHWNGRKPIVPRRPVTTTGRSASSIVLEDRG